VPKLRERYLKRAITRWFVTILLLCAGPVATACPLCLGAFRSSVAQQLVEVQNVVLAQSSANGRDYQILAVIKGERPADGVIPTEAIQLDFVATPTETLLLVRDETWSSWIGVGAISVENRNWLREIAGGKRPLAMDAGDWQGRVALMLPYLEHREPLVAKIAYGELAAAPYATLLSVQPRLSAPAIRRWLADPALSARRPLYLLLLGIAGDTQDAAALEQQLATLWTAGDATNLGSMIAADLQLRGPSRMAWIDERYMGDRSRSTRELEGALLALSVLGSANGIVPRERVIQSYLIFIREHQELAGFVAWDLAAWQYWGAAPLYRAIIQSNIRQNFASRVAIAKYLVQSPAGNMTDLDVSKTGVPDRISVEHSAAPVLPR
jgi:hypothetical protein